jgi:hypothetical protein
MKLRDPKQEHLQQNMLNSLEIVGFLDSANQVTSIDIRYKRGRRLFNIVALTHTTGHPESLVVYRFMLTTPMRSTEFQLNRESKIREIK